MFWSATHCGLPTATRRYIHIYFFPCERPRQPISTTHGLPFRTHLQYVPLCPRVDFFIKFCVERFVGCGCSYPAVVLYKSFPLPLRTTNHINILCSQDIAITVPASPPCWPSIPFTPAPVRFVPLSKSSFVFQIMSSHNPSFLFILVSTIYLIFFLAVTYLSFCRRFTRWIPCAHRSIYIIGRFSFFVPPFHGFVAYWQLLPCYYTCQVVDQFLPLLYVLSYWTIISFRIVLCFSYAFQQLAKPFSCVLGHLFLELLLIFFYLVYIFSIWKNSYRACF